MTDLPDQSRGLYRKYDVKRLYDTKGKHAACTYYVLDLKHDKYAQAALAAYADACAAEYPDLAADLRAISTPASSPVPGPAARTEPDFRDVTGPASGGRM